MSNLVTSGGLSQRTLVFAVTKMLAHAGAVTVLDKIGQTIQLPKNKGGTLKFRRPVPFTAATVPLVEGVTPSLRTFSFEDVEVTIKQYGEVVGITDVIEDLHEDPVLRVITKMLGENIGRTMEALTYGVVRAGTSVFYANGTDRPDVNSVLTKDLQRKVVRFLQAQKAQMVTQILSSSPMYETYPIEAAYVAVAHTDLASDIRNLAGFIATAEYGTRNTVSPYEIGSVENVRYVLSPDLSPWESVGGDPATNGVKTTNSTDADVYPILYFGEDAFGTVQLKGTETSSPMNAVQPTIIPVGRPTKSDPLAQRGYAGWKTYFASLILNQLWMARAEVAVDAL